jgi:hypothetical protein
MLPPRNRTPNTPAQKISPRSRPKPKPGEGKLVTSAAALEDLRDHIEIFLVDHPRALLSEPGKELLDLSDGSFSLDTEYGKLIWHIWNDRTNLVRQITSIAKEKPGRLELYYQRFGKGPPGTLIVADTRADSEALNRRGRRIEYLGHLRRWLAQLFPGAPSDGLTTEASLKDSLSGCYARGLLHEAGRSWAVMGVGPEESPAVIDGILTYGIIWLDFLRQRNPNRVITGLKVFVPHNFTETTQQRLAWMNRKVALWELYATGSTARLLDSKDAGNLRTRVQPPLRPVGVSPLSEEWMARVESLSPQVMRRAGSDGLLRWSVKGLVFARQRDASRASPVVYGLGRAETIVDERSLPRLERLVQQLLKHRRAEILSSPDERSHSSHAQHALYRLQPEQWLESNSVISRDHRAGRGARQSASAGIQCGRKRAGAGRPHWYHASRPVSHYGVEGR